MNASQLFVICIASIFQVPVLLGNRQRCWKQSVTLSCSHRRSPGLKSESGEIEKGRRSRYISNRLLRLQNAHGVGSLVQELDWDVRNRPCGRERMSTLSTRIFPIKLQTSRDALKL